MDEKAWNSWLLVTSTLRAQVRYATQYAWGFHEQYLRMPYLPWTVDGWKDERMMDEQMTDGWVWKYAMYQIIPFTIELNRCATPHPPWYSPPWLVLQRLQQGQ